MWLHRLFFFALIIMAFLTLNLDWFHHSYNSNSIDSFSPPIPASKLFWGDLFLHESYISYVLLSVFVLFAPKRLFLTTVLLRILIFIISLQILLGIIIIIIQSNRFAISSINLNFIIFLMVNLAIIRRFLSFWPAALSNSRYVDKNVLDKNQ
jgi:hypothetical protein